MRNIPIIKALSYRIIAQLRLPQLLHRVLFSNQLAILVYHAVVRSPLEIYGCCFLDEASFRSQIKYLKNHFEVLPLSEALERMSNGRIFRPTAVITFDDGFQNNYDFAFPILRETGLPATVFLTTGLVNTDDTVWYCRLIIALAKTNKPSLEWNGCKFNLSGPIAKAESSGLIQEKLKELPHPRLLAELRRIIMELGDDPDAPIEIGSPFRMLNHEAIAEMIASGLIEFGAHTHTHAILSRLSPKERRHEIERSVNAIHELTGHPCELFAYPNGSLQDYDTETIRTLENFGVRLSLTGIPEPNDKKTCPMELRRYAIGTGISMDHFQLTVHHFIPQIRRMIS